MKILECFPRVYDVSRRKEKENKKQELQQINGTRGTGFKSRTNTAEERLGIIRQQTSHGTKETGEY